MADVSDHKCTPPDAREFWERHEDPDLEEWPCPECKQVWMIDWGSCHECLRANAEGPKWWRRPDPCPDCTDDVACAEHKYPFPVIRVSRGGIRYGTEADA